eukprot:361540-Chlamydomonas_euryale.AAC.5
MSPRRRPSRYPLRTLTTLRQRSCQKARRAARRAAVWTMHQPAGGYRKSRWASKEQVGIERAGGHRKSRGASKEQGDIKRAGGHRKSRWASKEQVGIERA